MKIKYIPNVFDKSESVERYVEYKYQTVEKYFDEIICEDKTHIVPIVTGKKVEWDHIPHKDDEIIFVIEMGNNAVRTILGVVLTVVGYFYPVVLPIGLGLLASGIAGYMTPDPVIPTSPDNTGFGNSKTYSWDGIQNLYGEGNPVPVVYGEHRMGGLLVEGFIDGESDSGTQQRKYLNALLGMSEGPIFGIDTSTIKINNNDLSQFTSDVDYWTRDGAVDQTAIANFSKIARHYVLQSTVKIVNGVSNSYIYETYNAVDSAKVIINFPSLFGVDNGDIITQQVDLQVDYRLVGDVNWTLHSTPAVASNTKSSLEHDIQIDFPANGYYQIRIQRLTADFDTDPDRSGDSYLKAVVEFENATLTYPYVSLLGLRLKATDKLSGTMPTITALVQGRQLVDVRDLAATPTLAGSKNPANILYDLLTNERYGLGWYYNQGVFGIDMDSLITFANWCDETVDYTEYNPATGQYDAKQQVRYEMNLVLDSQHKAVDIINKICSNCRALPYWSGDSFKVVIERSQTTYAQSFSMGNIVADSFEEIFVNVNNIPSQAEAQFIDESLDYKTNIIAGIDQSRLGEGPQSHMQNMFGITNKARIKRELAFALRKLKALKKSISFQTGIDAIVCEVGDLIRFQHDIPGWGYGGRLLDASGQIATLDRNVSLTLGTQYSLRVRLPDNTSIRYDWTASADYTGNQLDVGQALDLSIAKNCLWQFGEIAIESKPFRVMSMMEVSGQKFKIEAVEYNDSIFTDDNSIQVSEVDYSRLGEVATYTINGSVATPHPAQGNPTYTQNSNTGQNDMPPEVDDVSIYEALVLVGNSYRSDLVVNFATVEMPQNSMARIVRYDIIYSIDGGATWTKHGEVRNGNYYRMGGVQVGQTYYIHVKPYTNYDVTNHIELTSNALVNAIAIQGKTAAPNEPTNLVATGDILMVRLAWSKPTDGDLDYIEVWRSTANDRSTAAMIGTANGTGYVDDGLHPSDTFYYWVRSLDTSGNYSAWYPASATAGIQGSPGNDPTKVLDMLTSSIQQSHLVQALSDKIDDSDTSIQSAVTLLNNQWTVKISENDHVAGAGVIMYPDYDSATAYVVDDIVMATDSNVYKCIANSTGNEPSASPTYWEVVPYGAKSEFVILSDKFAVVQPDGSGGFVTPFIVGTVNSVSQVGINGNLVIDGTINGVHIHAQSDITLSDGGKITVGNQNVIIESVGSGWGSIKVSPDGGPDSNHHIEIVDGDIKSRYWDGTQHHEYKSLQRVEFGQSTADGATYVNIPGIWKSAPAVLVSPSSCPIFDKDSVSVDQELMVNPGNISLQSGETMKYRFLPTVQLSYGSATTNRTLTNSGFQGGLVGPWPSMPATVVADTVTPTTTGNLRMLTAQISGRAACGNAATQYYTVNVTPTLYVNRSGVGWTGTAGVTLQSSYPGTMLSWSIQTQVYSEDITQWYISWYFTGSYSVLTHFEWSYTGETCYYPATTLNSNGVVNWIAIGE